MHAENYPALSPAEQQLAAHLRGSLDQTLADTDAVARARLAAARRRALDAANVPARRRAPLWAGAALAAGVVTALTLQWWPVGDATVAPSTDPDALEWLVAEENPELIQDLEFYEWLDSQVSRS